MVGVQDPKANIVAESWQENYVDLCQSAISQTLTVNELVDLEWKFGGIEDDSTCQEERQREVGTINLIESSSNRKNTVVVDFFR